MHIYNVIKHGMHIYSNICIYWIYTDIIVNILYIYMYSYNIWICVHIIWIYIYWFHFGEMCVFAWCSYGQQVCLMPIEIDGHLMPYSCTSGCLRGIVWLLWTRPRSYAGTTSVCSYCTISPKQVVYFLLNKRLET